MKLARAGHRANGDAGQNDLPHPPLRLPRGDDGRHLDQRPAAEPPPVRPVAARLLPGRARLARRDARRRGLPRPGADRRDHHRARAGRRRRVPTAAGLPAGTTGDLRRIRRAARVRRGDHRIREAGLLVRRPPLRGHAGPDDVREGGHQRLPSAWRGGRRTASPWLAGSRRWLPSCARWDVHGSPQLLRRRDRQPARSSAPRTSPSAPEPRAGVSGPGSTGSPRSPASRRFEARA